MLMSIDYLIILILFSCSFYLQFHRIAIMNDTTALNFGLTEATKVYIWELLELL